MDDRRSVYFSFQGLLMSVLLLIFLYQYKFQWHDPSAWINRFYFLVLALVVSLLILRLATRETLAKWWFQAGLFIGDAVLASLTLYWTQPQSDLYLIYFLIIYGTALTRSLGQSFVVTVVTSLLYLGSAWRPYHAFPVSTAFWLRFLFLWSSSALLAILSRDTQRAQEDQEQKYQGRIIQIERLATLGQVAGEVAHRIKGPLTTIMVNAEILSVRHGKSKEIVKELAEILEEAGHCKEILKHLLDLGRIEEIDFTRVNLCDAVRFALKSVEPQLRQLGLHVKTAGLEAPLTVMGDPSLLQEAIAAILQNAVEASRRGGPIQLSVTAQEPPFGWKKLSSLPGSYVVTISDEGKGVDPKDLENIFQPFYTTKGPQGSGLGLSAALRIFQKHRGTIEAYSDGPGLGARFTLTIPKVSRAESAQRG